MLAHLAVELAVHVERVSSLAIVVPQQDGQRRRLGRRFPLADPLPGEEGVVNCRGGGGGEGEGGGM